MATREQATQFLSQYGVVGSVTINNLYTEMYVDIDLTPEQTNMSDRQLGRDLKPIRDNIKRVFGESNLRERTTVCFAFKNYNGPISKGRIMMHVKLTNVDL